MLKLGLYTIIMMNHQNSHLNCIGRGMGRSLWERRSFRFASLEDRATPWMIVRYTHLKIASLEDGSGAAVYLKTKIRHP